MDPVMMQPAECDSILRIEALPRISVPRDNVMRFYAFRTAAKATGETVALADFV